MVMVFEEPSKRNIIIGDTFHVRRCVEKNKRKNALEIFRKNMMIRTKKSF